jgi:hypothetical protein
MVFLGGLTREMETENHKGKSSLHKEGAMKTRVCSSRYVIGLAVVMLVCGMAGQTWAGEKGKFRCRGMIMSTKANAMEVPINPAHSFVQGETDGVVLNETGGTFLDQARYQVFYMYDMIGQNGKGDGYKVFTLSDGSQIHARYQGEQKGTTETGTFTFIGGSGKYQNVKGQGTFHLTYITETLYVDRLEGEYELP